MTPGKRDIEQLRIDLQSAEIPVRTQAIDALMKWVGEDSGIHPRALEIFRSTWKAETYGYIALTAIRGIEQIAGASEAHAARVTLLDHPQAQMVAWAAIHLEKTPDIPKFLTLLRVRPTTEVHTTIVSLLGRTHDPEMRGPIAELLADPGVRPYAAQALGNLGDPAAIPDLEPHVNDPRPAWEIDNHGPMMSTGDVVLEAIDRLRHPAIGDPLYRPPIRPAVARQVPPEIPGVWRRCRHFVPLAAAIFTVPWFLMVIVPAIIFSGRSTNRTPGEMVGLDFLAMAPGVFGLFVGFSALLAKEGRTLRQNIITWIGCIACAMAITPFVYEAAMRGAEIREFEARERAKQPEPAIPATLPTMPPKLDIKPPSYPPRR